MLTLAIISVVLSVLAILISLRAEHNTRRQTVFMEEDREAKRRDDTEMAEWAAKLDQAVKVCRRIFSEMIYTAQSPTSPAYSLVFDHPELRQRIESYLIAVGPGRNTALARQVGDDELRLPTVRQTINDVLAHVIAFKEAHPEYAKTLEL
jgi:hypothetical protein